MRACAANMAQSDRGALLPKWTALGVKTKFVATCKMVRSDWPRRWYRGGHPGLHRRGSDRVGTAGLHRRGSTDCIFSGRTQRTGLHAVPRHGSFPLGCAGWSTGLGDIGRGSTGKTHPAISSWGHTPDGAARRGPGGRRPSIGAIT
jgi:hypothetical protein